MSLFESLANAYLREEIKSVRELLGKTVIERDMLLLDVRNLHRGKVFAERGNEEKDAEIARLKRINTGLSNALHEALTRK
jgi:hypothetical protein